MKRTEQRSAAEQPGAMKISHAADGNGAVAAADISKADLGAVLAGVQMMRDGNFSVRLPGVWTGVGGKIADTFNEIAIANHRISQELHRVGLGGGEKGKT